LNLIESSSKVASSLHSALQTINNHPVGDLVIPDFLIGKSSAHKSNRVASLPRPRRVRQGRRGTRGRSFISGSRGDSLSYDLPATIGAAIPKTFFRLSGSPQKHVDYDSSDGIRVTGHSYVGALSTNGSSYLTFTDANSNSVSGVSGAGSLSLPFGLSFLDGMGNSLSSTGGTNGIRAIASTFNWYAIRDADVTLHPVIGTNATGALVHCLDQDPDSGIPAAFGACLAQTFSSANSNYMPHGFRYLDRGTKLFEIYKSSDDPDLRYPADYVAAPSTTFAASTTFALVFVKYTVDLYGHTNFQGLGNVGSKREFTDVLASRRKQLSLTSKGRDSVPHLGLGNTLSSQAADDVACWEDRVSDSDYKDYLDWKRNRRLVTDYVDCKSVAGVTAQR